MAPIIVRDYNEELLQTINDISRHNKWWSAPINLGGVPGVSGGTGTPIGGTYGYLPQQRVAYDITEAAYLGIQTNVPSGTLYDNLAHIRYRLDNLEAASGGGTPGGSDGQIQYNNGGTFAGASQFYYDYVNNRIGLGTASPSGIIHVFQGDSGMDYFYSGYDDIIIENNSNAGITIATPNTNIGAVNFASPDNLTSAFLGYQHNTNTIFLHNVITGAYINLGSTILLNSFAQDINTYILGTGGTILFADAGNNRLGVGTSSPQSLLQVEGAITVNEMASPSTPLAGYGIIYAKTDGDLYYKNDAGTEKLLSNEVAGSVWFPDIPPASGLGSLDDYFDDSSLAGKWSEWDIDGVLDVSEEDYGLNLYVTTSAGPSWAGVYQEMPIDSGPFSVYTKISLLSRDRNYHNVGLGLFDGTPNSTNDFYSYALLHRNFDQKLEVIKWLQYDSGNTSYGGKEDGFIHLTVYLRIRYDGSDWHFEFSDDGVGWTESLADHTLTINYPSHVGIIVNNESNTWDSRAIVQMFKFEPGLNDITDVLYGNRAKVFV